MCLAAFMHIPHDVSAITEGYHLVKYGNSLKRYFLNSMFLVMLCVMKCRVVCHAHIFMLKFHVEKINVVCEKKFMKNT